MFYFHFHFFRATHWREKEHGAFTLTNLPHQAKGITKRQETHNYCNSWELSNERRLSATLKPNSVRGHSKGLGKCFCLMQGSWATYHLLHTEENRGLALWHRRIWLFSPSVVFEDGNFWLPQEIALSNGIRWKRFPRSCRKPFRSLIRFVTPKKTKETKKSQQFSHSTHS
jgi:hypothetical protein